MGFTLPEPKMQSKNQPVSQDQHKDSQTHSNENRNGLFQPHRMCLAAGLLMNTGGILLSVTQLRG